MIVQLAAALLHVERWVEPERSFLMAQMITWTFQRLALVRHARLMCGYFLSQRQEIIQL
jgi:hypothetical protein